MRVKLAFAVFVALFPVVAFGQGVAPYTVTADGCIVGRPCAFGVPLPPPNTGAYSIDADGCVVGQPCPYRGWRNNKKNDATKTTTDRTDENVYQTKRNADGTTDMIGFNPTTGSTWDQHFAPNLGAQSGHKKDNQPWTGRLVPPFGQALNSAVDSEADEPMNVEYEPSQSDRWQKEWWSTGGTMKAKSGSSPSAQSSTNDEEKSLDEYIRERTLLEQRASIAHVLSRMQPGLLAAAAKAAARERCVAATDANTRQACINQAEKR